MEKLGRLPHGDRQYGNVQHVWRALGGEVEEGHTDEDGSMPASHTTWKGASRG